MRDTEKMGRAPVDETGMEKPMLRGHDTCVRGTISLWILYGITAHRTHRPCITKMDGGGARRLLLSATQSIFWSLAGWQQLLCSWSATMRGPHAMRETTP